MPREIQIGDVYKTRDGRQVTIIWVDLKKNDQPIVGIVQYPNGSELAFSFSKDGTFIPGKTNPADLLIEPEINDYTNIYIDEENNLAFSRPASKKGRVLRVYVFSSGELRIRLADNPEAPGDIIYGQ